MPDLRWGQRRLLDKSAQGRDLSNRNSRKADEIIHKNFSEEELKSAIQDRNVSDRDKERYIEAWIDKHYEADRHRIMGLSGVLISSIGENGIDDNPTIQYIDKFLASPELTKYTIDSDYVSLINSLVANNVVEPETDWLYEPWLYNESEQDNIHKLKAIAFVSNKDNVKRYGLENTNGEPLSINDLKGKPAQEMLDILDASQTRNFEDEDTTFVDIARDNRSGGQDLMSYFSSIIDKMNIDNKDDLKKTLELISKDDTAKKNFLYTDTSEATFQKDLVTYLQDYIKGNRRNLKTKSNNAVAKNGVEDNVTLNDWMKSKGLNSVTLYGYFDKLVRQNVSKYKASNYTEYLRQIVDSTKWLNRLLKSNLKENSDEAALEVVISFLNSFNEMVKKLNRNKKAESDLKNKPEVKQLMNDVVDMLVTNLQLTRPEALTKFKQNYTPGISEEDLVNAIIRTL